MDTRKCYRCGFEKHTEDYAVDRSKRSGRKSICKVCDRQKVANYYDANRDAVRARAREQQRAYYAEHSEKMRARRKARYAAKRSQG